PVPAIRALGAIMTSIIHEDAQQRLWLATDANALYMLDNGVLTTHASQHGPPANRVLAIHEDGQGGLWLGTTAGLAHLRDGQATLLARGVGPQTETIIQIIRDRHDTYWMTTNRGLFAIAEPDLQAFAAGTTAKLIYRSYGIAD